MDFSLYEILIQLGIFLIILLVLKQLYIEPLLRLIKRREELTTGRQETAAELTGKIQELKKHYHEEIRKLSTTLESEQTTALKNAREHADKAVVEAARQSEAEYKKMQEELNHNLKAVRSNLSKISDEVSKEVLGAVMSSRVVRL